MIIHSRSNSEWNVVSLTKFGVNYACFRNVFLVSLHTSPVLISVQPSRTSFAATKMGKIPSLSERKLSY